MFLPRCLATRGAPPDLPLKKTNVISKVVERFEHENDDEPIKARCIEQRNAEAGEPRCAVCGRFGEYICDATEDDVCSLECKKVVLRYRELRFQAREGGSKAILGEWEPAAALPPDEIEALREEINVSVCGDAPPAPIVDFEQCGFVSRLQENLSAAGYDSPTPIQMQVLPAALAGRDVLVSSHTGSGKTLSFLLPLISKCCRIRMGPFSEEVLPLAIILTPTRELCSQVEEQAKILGKGLPFKTALVVGGDVMPQQVYRIKKGVELVVGTPGRLLDVLYKHENINLSEVCMLVLDEVDCMLERGFREQVVQIVRALSNPQILLFSATVPPEIEKLAMSMTRSLLVISAGDLESGGASGAVRQTILWVENKNKKKKLFEILQSSSHFQPPGVVFVNSRLGAELLADAVEKVTGLRCASLHGQRTMNDRREVMEKFLAGNLDVVVATGVLGRGLDLLRVQRVVIFDMPNTLQEYMHQVGRASRLDEPGFAIGFINNESKSLFKELAMVCRNAGVALPKAVTMASYVQDTNPRKRKAR